jgi:hypothetical protein
MFYSLLKLGVVYHKAGSGRRSKPATTNSSSFSTRKYNAPNVLIVAVKYISKLSIVHASASAPTVPAYNIIKVFIEFLVSLAGLEPAIMVLETTALDH